MQPMSGRSTPSRFTSTALEKNAGGSEGVAAGVAAGYVGAMRDAEERLRAALMKVPSGLAEHVLRVVDEATRLAVIHGIDVEAARIAALGHDLLRAHSGARLLG